MASLKDILRKKIKSISEPVVVDATEVAKKQIKKTIDSEVVPVFIGLICVAVTYYSVIKPPKSNKDIAKVINNYYYNYYIIKK